MTRKAAKPVDLEKALTDLEALVERLESGELKLDEALKQFEQGVKLTRQCQAALREAEQKVEILLQKTADAETAPLPNHEQEES
jgi:exodeoxyribonuclease VII small subunit